MVRIGAMPTGYTGDVQSVVRLHLDHMMERREMNSEEARAAVLQERSVVTVMQIAMAVRSVEVI